MFSILLCFLGNRSKMVADVLHRHSMISLTLSENSSVKIVFYAKKRDLR